MTVMISEYCFSFSGSIESSRDGHAVNTDRIISQEAINASAMSVITILLTAIYKVLNNNYK